MYTDIVVRYGEISLKGKNRKIFENILIKNVRAGLKQIGDFQIERAFGRIYLRDVGGLVESVVDALVKIPGIVSVSPIVKSKLDIDDARKKALDVLKDALPAGGTFKVEAKRSNKQFSLNSPEINQAIGAHLLINFPQKLSVDVHNPDSVVHVEVRNHGINIYSRIARGPGGLPVGSGGRGLLLISGGIDSPVAGWLGMKRGVVIDALHFYSFPFTSERSKEKVIELTRILSQYCGKIRLFIGYFTNIQKAIGLNCPEKLHITIMRRMMFRMATKIARRFGAKVLFTGECIGQVASQTLESIEVINAVTDLPVFRPLITNDKTDIIAIARKIGTYETSILPYEDCCTVFVPASPVTKPKLEQAEKAEADLDIEALIEDAINQSKVLIVTPEGVQAEYNIVEN